MKKILFAIGLCAITGLFNPNSALANIYEFDVMGRGDGPQTSWGFGKDGLYLGPNFSGHNFYNANYRFNFDNVKLRIDESTGNGHMFGEIRNLRRNDVWVMDITLTGMVFRESAPGTIRNPKHFASSSPYVGMIADLLTAPEGRGLEWTDVFLKIDKKNPAASTAYTGPEEFMGFEMPNMGHFRGAELHNSRYGLEFDAWYKSLERIFNQQWVGDTKAFAKNPRDVTPPDNPAVPEPGTFALMGIGLAGLAFYKRRKAVVAETVAS